MEEGEVGMNATHMYTAHLCDGHLRLAACPCRRGGRGWGGRSPWTRRSCVRSPANCRRRDPLAPRVASGSAAAWTRRSRCTLPARRRPPATAQTRQHGLCSRYYITEGYMEPLKTCTVCVHNYIHVLHFMYMYMNIWSRDVTMIIYGNGLQK